MKPSFHTRLINNPFEDPGLYIRLIREGRALLFDLGFTNNLSVRDILKISDIFVTHTHVDHFIGFDGILRHHLRKEEPLRLYGPEGFIERIKGKLRGYTWNLIGDYPLVIEVSEVNEKGITKAVFKAENSFKREEMEAAQFNGILTKDSLLKVSTVVLDHQIPCLAFSLEEDYHINIDKAKLSELNLPVGPWLKGLKDAIRKGIADRIFTIKDKKFTPLESPEVKGRNAEDRDITPLLKTGFKPPPFLTGFTFTQLNDIAGVTRGQKISYVVDALGSEENIRKIVDLVKGSDILYAEAYFLDKDRDRAKERYHLTAKEAGRIAREAGVVRLVLFHFSPKYIDAPDELVKEAEKELKKGGLHENRT